MWLFLCLSVELQRLARDSSSEEVKKQAQGALWILEDKTSTDDTVNSKETGNSLYCDSARCLTCNDTVAFPSVNTNTTTNNNLRLIIVKTNRST